MLKKDVVFPKTLQKRMKMLMNISKSSKLIFSASSLFSIAKIRSKGKAWAKPNDHGLVLTARHSLANPRLLGESYILAGCHKNMNATQTLATSSYSNTLSDSGTRKRKVVMEISRNLLDMVRDFYSIG